MSVYVITHKKFPEKKQKFYKVLLVGAHKGHTFGQCFDDEGDNISEKNGSFCELTGAYWIWKNVKDDVVGIVHYRRYFSTHFGTEKILTENEIRKKLKDHDMILPFKHTITQSLEEQYYTTSGKKKDLDLLHKVISEKYPEYLHSYDTVMKGKEVYFFNMMICRKELYDKYYEWLFDILFELEKRVDTSDYDDYQKRIFGFLSERLLSVWVYHNNINIFEVGVINTEEKWPLKKRILTGLKRFILFRVRR